MHSKLLLFIMLPLFIIALSCAAYKYVPPYKHFDHEKHNDSVAQEKMDCFSCHNVTVTEKDPQKRIELLKKTLKESDDKRFVEGTCHKCHVDKDTRVENGTDNCRACHDDLRSVMPDDHKGLWVNMHGDAAKEVWYDGGFKKKAERSKLTNYPTCDNCHSQWFCVDCHTSRDLAKAKMHPRTFRTAHVAAAVADPASCSSCHTTRYCRDCHDK